MPKVNSEFEQVILVYLTQPDADYQVQGRMNYRMKRVPQLGLQYLAAMLAQKGIKTEFLDQALTPFGPSLIAEKWRTGRYGFVGFYSDTSLKNKVIRFIHRLLEIEPEMAVVVGGPGYPAFEEYHRVGTDIVCHGEGEMTVLDIAEIYKGHLQRSGVPGISWVENGDVFVGPERPLIDDLDRLPFPDRDSTPLTSYYDWHFFGMRTPFITAMAARGCPNKCSFCCSPALGSRVRRRSAGNVLTEIDELIGKYGIRYVGYKDDIFVLHKPWVYEFCEGLISRGSPIRFSCNMHPLSFKADAMQSIGLMRRAGLDMAVFGIQTVTPSILKTIRRREEEPARLAEIGKILKKNGVSVVYEFILGLPGDTDDTMAANLRYALKTRPHYGMFYTLSVLEGSEIHSQYGNSAVCTIPREKQQKLASKFARRFFFDPRVFIRNFFHVLRKNPRWIIRNLLRLSYFIEATGVIPRRGPREEIM